MLNLYLVTVIGESGHRHVLTVNGSSKEQVRKDVSQISLVKEVLEVKLNG